MSLKVCWVARLRAGAPAEEMRAHWTDVHGRELGSRLPGLRGYVQSHVIGSIGPQGMSDAEVGFDGYSVHEYDDAAAFDAMLASPEWDAVVEDGPNVFDLASLDGASAVLEERIMRDGPTSPYKVVWFARFRTDVPFEQSADHWLKVHGQIALGAPGIDRYVQNLTVGSITANGLSDQRATYFDGFSECWYADEAAYLESQASKAWDDLYQDGFNFLQVAELNGMSAVLDERVIV